MTIPANTLTATIDVTGIIDDTIVEGTETVIVTLTGTDDVLIGVDATPATVNILDNDSATVSIAATTDANETSTANGLFTLTQTTTSESATVVSLHGHRYGHQRRYRLHLAERYGDDPGEHADGDH